MNNNQCIGWRVEKRNSLYCKSHLYAIKTWFIFEKNVQRNGIQLCVLKFIIKQNDLHDSDFYLVSHSLTRFDG